MNKKALSLTILLAMATTGVFAANTVQTTDAKLAKYQAQAIKTAQQGIVGKMVQDTTVPSAVSLNETRTVDLALENNRTVKQSSWSYEAAKANVSVAAAAKNPTVKYDYSVSDSGDGDTQSGHDFTLVVPVYTGGKAESALESARYSREGAGAAYEEAQQTAKLQAISDYYSLVMARNKVDIAQQTIRDYEGHLTNVNAQYNVGIVAKSDVLASQTSLANGQTSLVTAKNSANLAEATLNNVLGLPVQTTIETADKDMPYRPYDVTLEKAKAYALLNRAALVQSAMTVKAAEETVESARAGKRPTVNVSAGEGYKSAGSWKGTDNHDWSIGTSVSWSLWDGGQSDANVKAAKANLEKAKEANYQQIDKVLLEVQQAYLNLRAAEQTISSTRTAVEEGQENFRIASLRYRAGVGTNLDVLDAETKLAEARNNYVDALYNYNVSVATLEQSVGIPVEIPVAQGAAIINNSDALVQLSNLAQSETVK